MARADFENIPPRETFTAHRVWKYIGEPFNLNVNQYQKKMPRGWIHNSIASCKPGQPQICYRYTCITSLHNVITTLNEDGTFKEWALIAKNKEKWNNIIDDYTAQFILMKPVQQKICPTEPFSWTLKNASMKTTHPKTMQQHNTHTKSSPSPTK